MRLRAKQRKVLPAKNHNAATLVDRGDNPAPRRRTVLNKTWPLRPIQKIDLRRVACFAYGDDAGCKTTLTGAWS